MSAIKKISKTIAYATIFGAAMYAVVYVVANRSEAFGFVDQEIRNSQTIKARVGDIKKIRLSTLGAFDQKTVNPDERVSMMIDVSGSTTSLVLELKAKKENGAWLLQSVRSGDQILDLNWADKTSFHQ